MLFQKPVGKTANVVLPSNIDIITSSCSGLRESYHHIFLSVFVIFNLLLIKLDFILKNILDC
jgi:hypothetical protein